MRRSSALPGKPWRCSRPAGGSKNGGSDGAARGSRLAARRDKLVANPTRYRRYPLTTRTKEGRLAEIRQRIDDLEARARNGTPEMQERLQRRFDALLDDAEAAGGAIDERTVLAEEKLFDLEARVDSTAKRVSAELSGDKESFAHAVEEELDGWNAAIERLQARAAEKAASARDQAETSVVELRQARNRAAERLAEARSSRGEAWEEQKKRVTAALDELEQKARGASARFR